MFLAPNLRAHVTRENARLIRSRGISGLARLAFRRVVQELAGLPGAILKSPEQAAGADRVFAINLVIPRHCIIFLLCYNVQPYNCFDFISHFFYCLFIYLRLARCRK